MPDQIEPPASKRPWATGILLQGALGNPEPGFWRVVHVRRENLEDMSDGEVDPARTIVFLLKVDPLCTPHSTVLPKAFQLDYLLPRLTEVAECVRLADMNREDQALPSEMKAKRDSKFSCIAELVAPHRIGELLAKASRGETLRKHAANVHQRASWIRRVLTRYWWYGCDKNALCELRSLRGGPGKERLTPGSSKRGARNAVAQDDPDSPLRGANFDLIHRDKFIEALLIYWIGEGLSLAKSYQQMKDNLYRVAVRRADGTTYYRRTPSHKIPTLGIFYEHSRSLITSLGLKNRNLGRLDYASQESSKSGHARDITSGPGDIFDMDSTEFNFQLVASFDVGLRVGRPTVYLVVDRNSTCIVGLYADCRPERWEGYRRALYCAFTPKADLLSRLDMEKYGKILDVYGVPNGVFSDRGPARSDNALSALCDELKLEKALPPPHRPDLNPVVESLHNKMQTQLSRFDGGFTREKGQRAEERRNKARANAVFTEEQFFKLLIAAAHDHNTSTDASHLLLPKMGDIIGCPQAIFQWGLRNSPINHHRHMSNAELYAKLLPSKTASVSNKGIRHERALYNSPELQNWRRKQTEKRPRIQFHIDADPKYVYWRPTSREWKELPMSLADQQKAQHMTWTDVEAFRKRGLQGAIKQRTSSHRKGVLSKVSEEVIREAAANVEGRRPPKKVVRNDSIREVRKITAAARQKDHAAAGRRTMQTVATADAQALAPTAPPKPSMPSKPAAKTRAPKGEPTLEELHKMVFK